MRLIDQRLVDFVEVRVAVDEDHLAVKSHRLGGEGGDERVIAVVAGQGDVCRR